MAQRYNHLYGEHLVLPEAVIEELGGPAARPGRAQDEQELRQHDPAVHAARAVAQADRRHRDRLARPRRAQGHRGLRPVPDLPGLRRAPRKPPRCARPTPKASPGATPSSCCSNASTAKSRPMRERYHALIADPAQIERILLAGAPRRRARCRTPFIGRLRARRRPAPARGRPPPPPPARPPKVARPCLQAIPRRATASSISSCSTPRANCCCKAAAFASPQEAGRAIGRLQQEGGAALAPLAEQLEPADNDRMRAAAEALEALAAPSLAANGG